jgi:hypothetical protein
MKEWKFMKTVECLVYVECAMLLLIGEIEEKDTQQPHSTCARHPTVLKNFKVL